MIKCYHNSSVKFGKPLNHEELRKLCTYRIYYRTSKLIKPRQEYNDADDWKQDSKYGVCLAAS